MIQRTTTTDTYRARYGSLIRYGKALRIIALLQVILYFGIFGNYADIQYDGHIVSSYREVLMYSEPLAPNEIEEISDEEEINIILKKLPLQINFSLHKEGVKSLPIYHGITVLHNFSATKSYHHVEFAKHKIFVLRFDSGFMKENFMFLPPTQLNPPYGLSEQQIKLFWKQRDYIVSYQDTREWHVSVSWDITNGISVASDSGKCVKHNSSHHVNFCDWPKQIDKPEIDGIATVNAAHDIYSYQHFFDNGWPHVAVASMSTGIELSKIHIFTEGCGSTIEQINKRLGYASQHNCINAKMTVSAKRLILNPVVRVVHDYYFDYFTELMKLPNLTRNKVILLPRGLGKYGGKSQRIINNLLNLVDPLSKKFGKDNVMVFDVKNYPKLDDLINLFSSAKFIIGPHGGAFYNQFYGGRKLSAIEMLPIKEDGNYPPMNFGQMCIYSNTQMLHQKLYRYYTFSGSSIYNIDIDDFMKWFEKFT